MLEFTCLIPLFTGIISMFLPVRLSRGTLIVTALLHLQLSVMGWLGKLPLALEGYFAITNEGMIVLLVTSFVFLFISIYAVSYLNETEISSEPIYIGCTLFFLATMSMAALADHLVVLWISIEATTLMSAPLIFLHRSNSALETTWKYGLICSGGIALALLGCFEAFPFILS